MKHPKDIEFDRFMVITFSVVVIVLVMAAVLISAVERCRAKQTWEAK